MWPDDDYDDDPADPRAGGEGGSSYDVLVDFDAIASNGVVFIPADQVKRDVILTPGAMLTVGDADGNRCPARVVANENAANADGRVTLQLILSRFMPAVGAGRGSAAR